MDQQRYGAGPTAFAVADYAAPTPGNLIRVLLLGLLLAALSIAFCEVIHAAPKLYKSCSPMPICGWWSAVRLSSR